MDMDNVKWSGWDTVDTIGSGSFGTVYEIQRTVLGSVEKAALKVIQIPKDSSDIDELYNDGYDEESVTSKYDDHLKSIVAEYEMMRKMNDCVNVVRCDDIRYERRNDCIGWNIFIKMELLTSLMKSLPIVVSETTVIKIAKDICNALVCCKKYGILHRDIKPQNLFVSKNGDYKLGDFGIAKSAEKTMCGTHAGTEKYMAPEVYNNQPYGASADIYSLGLVLYWMLNNRRLPFLPTDSKKITFSMEDEAKRRRVSGERIPAPINGSDALKTIVLKACEFNPKDRYSSAKEMLDALNNIGRNANYNYKYTSTYQKTATNDFDGKVNDDTISSIIDRADKGDTNAMLEVIYRYCIAMYKKQFGINLFGDDKVRNAIREKLYPATNNLKNGTIVFLRTDILTESYGNRYFSMDLNWRCAREYVFMMESLDESFRKDLIDIAKENLTKTFAQGEYKQAASYCLSVLSYDSKDVDALNLLGRCYRELNRSDMAVECYKKAMGLAPQNAITYINAIVAYFTLNKMEEAKQCAEKAFEYIDTKDSNYATLLANSAMVEARLGNIKYAKKLYRKAMTAGYNQSPNCKKLKEEIKMCEKKQSDGGAKKTVKTEEYNKGKQKLHWDASLIASLILFFVGIIVIPIIPPYGIAMTIIMTIALIKMFGNRIY